MARRKRNIRAYALATMAVALAGTAQPASALVLKTITVDGSMADWSDVLADPTQNCTDGVPDKDAPVPTTGRDLERFAWTFDPSYLYLYTARAGSDSNRQRFWFYLDTNDNKKMNTGEPVILVSWFGSNRRTVTSGKTSGNFSSNSTSHTYPALITHIDCAAATWDICRNVSTLDA